MTQQQQTPSAVWTALACCLLTGGLAAGLFALLNQTETDKIADVVSKAVTSKPSPRISAQAIAGPHLAWAREESTRRIAGHLKPIRDFLSEAKSRTPEFAKQALSFSSKWRLIADYVPGTKGNRHEAYLRDRFESILFTPAQLKRLIEVTVRNFEFDIESVENELLVRIRRSAVDIPELAALGKLDSAELQRQYEAAFARVIADSQADFARSAAGEVVSLITGEVLTQVAVRLGVSAGILGSGAASSPYTLGIGIVVGVIVDQIVTFAWDRIADPKGELARELNQKFDLIEQTLLVGDAEHPGLEPRFQRYASQRAEIREQAIIKLINSYLETTQ